MTGISRSTIADTHARIARHIRLTPLIEVQLPGIDQPVTLKLELLQHSGSFKARGAFSNLLTNDVPQAGVTAASGGNHGAAIAYAAQVLGIPAHIFVPEASPQAKIDKIRSYGADITAEGKRYADALELCQQYTANSGAMPVHAYDSVATLRGQGTLAKELHEQAPDLETVIVAVGGGGLIGGMAAWYDRAVKVIAVEPHSCATLHRSLQQGERVVIEPSGLAMDALGASSVGELMFPIAQRSIDRAVLVSDDNIRAAQRWLWDNLRLIAEPGGATALAALLANAYQPGDGEIIGVVICGANTDPATFAAAIAN